MSLVSGVSVEFRLPAPPPSMNALYNIIYGQKRVEMKPEIRAYKNTAKMYVPMFDTTREDKLGLDITVSQEWFFKNGAMKKQDVQNMAKVLIDCIAEKVGFDDSQVWTFTLNKSQEVIKPGVQVKLYKLSPQGESKPKGLKTGFTL